MISVTAICLHCTVASQCAIMGDETSLYICQPSQCQLTATSWNNPWGRISGWADWTGSSITLMLKKILKCYILGRWPAKMSCSIYCWHDLYKPWTYWRQAIQGKVLPLSVLCVCAHTYTAKWCIFRFAAAGKLAKAVNKPSMPGTILLKWVNHHKQFALNTKNTVYRMKPCYKLFDIERELSK